MTDFDSAPERFDSREAIERLRELEGYEDADILDEDEREELTALRELADSGIAEWEYGASFIREDQFEDYARELAEDLGAISSDFQGWPASCIDWERAARELAQDYTSVTFQGSDYYVRS